MKASPKPHDKNHGQGSDLHETSRAALEISVDEARALLRINPRVIVLDVRSGGELCLGHIEGARFVPPGLIEEEADRLFGEKDLPILVYCSAGDRSLRVAERLTTTSIHETHSIGWTEAVLFDHSK